MYMQGAAAVLPPFDSQRVRLMSMDQTGKHLEGRLGPSSVALNGKEKPHQATHLRTMPKVKHA